MKNKNRELQLPKEKICTIWAVLKKEKQLVAHQSVQVMIVKKKFDIDIRRN